MLTSLAVGAGIAGLGALGGMFGANAIEQQKDAINSLVNEYMRNSANLFSRYEDYASRSEILNLNSLTRPRGFGINQTMLNNFYKAFQIPQRLEFRNNDNEY